ncbi:MAG: 1,4-alpha-glucan-branching protein [Chlamydiales bacterium]|jgi:1,4-alpha-glucan branching enzyme|nr:1,4-alpha-glucan-branching protein [Chlamydiales bacterium]
MELAEKNSSLDPAFAAELDRLIYGNHYNPHQILGLHPYFDNQKVIRVYRPGADSIYVEVFDQIISPQKVHDAGIFEYVVPAYTTYSDYKVYHQNSQLAYDPYAFLPTFGDLDGYLFNRGVHYDLYNVLGAHTVNHQGVMGTKFTVWAPSAKSVALVGDFNYWNGATNPMRSMGGPGVWELFIPGLKEGEKYKFEIKTQNDEILLKSDPYALAAELRPSTASVIFNLDQYTWKDQHWVEQRARNKDQAKPMNIYEVHLGSWQKGENGEFLNYREIAHRLAKYCKEMGFSHVELMPLAEHPLDESWGYQVTGFYAVTSRYGTPRDFQYFVDVMHQEGIGVILDWVPAHFPTDAFSLGKFDGTALYEHEDMRKGFHPHWNTFIFNYDRHEVSNFLIANALFWFDKMHIDGLRVDAVASMLYLDYGRDGGDWIPNPYGGKENIGAIEMMKHLNSVVHSRFPGALMIAEESTAFAGVTCPVDYNGLGFDLKWNMGWMNDTLRYFHKDPIYRSYHHHDLTFGLIYAFSEKFALVLSHDEVVHGKNSLLSKMPGDVWQKFANLRLLYSYMMCQPGKKLLFMGGEIGQWNEWNCKSEVEWNLLQFPNHKNLQNMVRDMNHFYLNHSALWEHDFDHTGFEWITFSDSYNCIISYKRKSSKGDIICVHNFTPTYHGEYTLHASHIKSIQEVFNTDSTQYGGSGKVNHQPRIVYNGTQHPEGVAIQIAPLATMIFEVEYI